MNIVVMTMSDLINSIRKFIVLNGMLIMERDCSNDVNKASIVLQFEDADLVAGFIWGKKYDL